MENVLNDINNELCLYTYIFKLITHISKLELNDNIYYNEINKLKELYNLNKNHKNSKYTLLDLYVYATFFMKDYKISYIIFQLIYMNICENNEQNILYEKISIENLCTLNNILNKHKIHNKNEFTKICTFKINIKDTNIYKHSFLYFVNDIYIKMKSIYFVEYLDLINKLYENINNTNILFIDFKSNYDINEVFLLIDYISEINNNDLYDIFVNNLSNLSFLYKQNILFIWLRFIYYKDDKNKIVYIAQNIHDDTNILETVEENISNIKINKMYKIGNNDIIENLDYTKYINDISLYINNLSTTSKKFFYDVINQYVNEFYIELLNKSKSCECSICLDIINLPNFSYCINCNNMYHHKCCIELSKISNKCALCRKDLSTYVHIDTLYKYDLYKKIFEKINI
jgi:hypothetical protein